MSALTAPPLNLATTAEAAARYHVSTKTILRRIQDGTLSAFRIGPQSLRIDLDQADEVFTGSAASTINGAGHGR
ncbi:helix-turn-helix domain-containing protein [Nesterenkonia sp. CF4.4]|uniref:helix-turn-helix domain-containing protein n=1 Tax=Nesterenkonia sp. CF4.4 TaxID=3373079 RepID=UPI003EE7DD11